MAAVRVEEIYERHIKPLPPTERLRLLAMVAQDLAAQSSEQADAQQRSLLELEGLGAEIW